MLGTDIFCGCDMTYFVRRRGEHYMWRWKVKILRSKREILDSSNKLQNSKRRLVKSAGRRESYKHKR